MPLTLKPCLAKKCGGAIAPPAPTVALCLSYMNKCFASKDPAEICKIYQFTNRLKYFGQTLIKS